MNEVRAHNIVKDREPYFILKLDKQILIFYMREKLRADYFKL